MLKAFVLLDVLWKGTVMQFVAGFFDEEKEAAFYFFLDFFCIFH